MSTRGYSLIEVALALGLLALVTLSVVAVVGAGLRARLQGEQHVVATEIANDVLERIRADGYLSIPAVATSFDGRIPQPPVGDFPPPPYPSPSQAPEYRIQVESEPVARNLRRVRVTVFSKEASTRLESLFHP